MYLLKEKLGTYLEKSLFYKYNDTLISTKGLLIKKKKNIINICFNYTICFSLSAFLYPVL